MRGSTVLVTIFIVNNNHDTHEQILCITRSEQCV